MRIRLLFFLPFSNCIFSNWKTTHDTIVSSFQRDCFQILLFDCYYNQLHTISATMSIYNGLTLSLLKTHIVHENTSGNCHICEIISTFCSLVRLDSLYFSKHFFFSYAVLRQLFLELLLNSVNLS